jgi:hypothetical protein
LRFVNFHSELSTNWTGPMVNALERLLFRWKEMVNAADMKLTNVSPLQ